MPEEDFIPGVDPGIKVWKESRESVRAYILNKKPEPTIPSKSRYEHRRYWENELHNQYVNPGSSPHVPGIHSALSLKEFCEIVCQNDTKTSITTAMNHRHINFLEYLLSVKGISVNATVGNNRSTLLHLAAGDGDIDKVKYLLSQGAKTNLKDKHKQTALFLCVNVPRILHPFSIMHLLLDNGCDINARDERGYTVLHQVCILNDLICVELLLKRRVKVGIKDKKGKVAIEYVKKVTAHI